MAVWGHRKRAEAGFTLMEIMLVVIIIGVLAAMVMPSLVGRAESSRITAAKADINGGLATALSLYEQDTGSFPTTAQGLNALLAAPAGVTNWKGPYFTKNEIPLDPWSRSYVYTCPGTHNTASYDLMSYGKDGKEGGGDDVANYSATATK
jgi:general secretion pathway protein G